MDSRWTKSKLAFSVLLLGCLGIRPALGQVSTEEAERRLREKLASRPAATQPAPATESDRLHEENRRLRQQVLSLQQEVATLKDALARASASSKPTGSGATATTGGGPTSRPAPQDAADANRAVAGHWRGGDATAGAGYLLDFNADGTYRQSWVAFDRRDTGQFRVADDVLEMWSNGAPEDRKHNRYRLSNADGQITLTPLQVDGVDVRNGRPLVLRKAE